MAIVSVLGRPSYFIIFTCNPYWVEIVRELRNGGETPADRPDLCVRVFAAKLQQLISDIKTKPYIFGNNVIGFTHVVEFQKRGLPHAHMVVIVDEQSRRPTLATYDKYIRIQNAPSIIQSNTYIVEETFVDSKGFVHYRRRSQQRSSTYVKFGDYNADNRWVIPHNLYLVTKYDAHINVEICSGVNAIKYLHKYITKGSDKSQIRLEADQEPASSPSSSTAVPVQEDIGNNDRDEISNWINARYLSASEACWRLLGKS